MIFVILIFFIYAQCYYKWKAVRFWQICKRAEVKRDGRLSSFTYSYQRETCLYLSKTPQAFREGKRNCYDEFVAQRGMKFIPLKLSTGLFNDNKRML